MPAKVKKMHDRMSYEEALKAAEELRAKAMECDYFSNDCEQRGKDGLGNMADNLNTRADYEEGIDSSPDVVRDGYRDWWSLCSRRWLCSSDCIERTY